ncbi:hypothetical protein JXO59_03360 [candidate division KSB1 bacterium]|nr:hypothetical protein [candidate division KSB1 bacterium]
MKTSHLTFIMLLIALTLFGQSRSHRGFEEQWQRLHQQIQAARELLRLFPDRQAENYILQAERWALEAQTLYADQQVVPAQQKLNLGFDAVSRAMDILSTVPAQRAQERVEELIRRADQVVPASGNQEAERLLNRGKEHLRMAKQAFRGRQAQRGLEYLRLAKSLVERSLQMAEKSGSGPGHNIETERMRFLDLMQKAEATVATCQNPRAERLLQQARRQAENVEPLIRRGEIKLAIGLYYNATRLLLRAIDICEGRAFSEQDQAREESELLDSMIEQVRGHSPAGLGPKRRIILSKVLQLQNQARQAYAMQQYGTALRRIELARTLLARIWSEDVTEEGTRQELQRLENDIEKLKTQKPSQDKPRFDVLLRAAENSAREANRYLQRGRTRLALVAILAGNRFLGLARSLAPDVPYPDRQQLLQQLQRLQQKIEAQIPTAAQEEKLEEIEFARQLQQRAEQALTQNDLKLAAEYIRLADELVDRAIQ